MTSTAMRHLSKERDKGVRLGEPGVRLAVQGGPFRYTYTTNNSSDGNFDFGGFSDPFDIFEQFFGGAIPSADRQGDQYIL